MYEYLKVLFEPGEDGQPVSLTFDQLVEKLNGNKNLTIVNLADGGYVGKDKFDAKDFELKGVKEQLENANNTIQSYKDMDIEGIKNSVSTWEQKYNEDTNALKEQLAAQEQAHSLDMFLGEYKFSSKAAREGIKAAVIGKKFPYENGGFIGAKEYVDGLMSDDDYKAAFIPKVVEPDPEPTPPQPKPKFTEPNPKPTTPPAKARLADLMVKKNENPNATIKYE